MTKKFKNKYKPSSKELIKERDNIQKVAAETNDSETRKKYKHLRNRITCRLKSEENIWQRNKLT